MGGFSRSEDSSILDLGLRDKLKYYGYNGTIEIENIPNIYEFNDKRYEVQCLNYLRNLNLLKYDMLIADSGSCEAILRYLESEQLKCVILIDSPDIYTAGERHGRDFRYSLISSNCIGSISLIATTETKLIESKNIHNSFPLKRTNLYSISEGNSDNETNSQLGKIIIDIII